MGTERNFKVKKGLSIDSGTILMKEQADAETDVAAYGQIWVNTATPNELYFTTDAGDDIQLTSGTGTAGGGGASDIDGLSDGKSQDLSIGLGANALYQATSGQANSNICLGANTGYAITIADNNTLVGVRAGSDINANDNVAVGYQAFRRGTGSYNTAVGPYAGEGVSGQSDGTYNTFIGHTAGFAYTSGAFNTFLGSKAGAGLTTGSSNVGIGYTALNATITGDKNIGVGEYSGALLTDGDHNIFMGRSAGYGTTIGNRNIAIGNQAYDASDTESDNLAIGYEALTTNLAGGEYNVAIGNYAGKVMTGDGADNNTLVGYNSGVAVTSGGHNTALGSYSYWRATDGTYNVVAGYNAGGGLRSGGSNIVLGYNTMGQVNNDGDGNVAIGVHSMNAATGNDVNYNTGVGFSSLQSITEGAKNIAIGWTAGNNITSGDNNVVIGAADVASATGDDQLSISSGDGSPVWITGDSNGNVSLNQLADVVAVTGNTTLTQAQSGSYVYWTAGTLTLPLGAVAGTHYTIFNNTGGSVTVDATTGDRQMVSGWAGNAAVADHDATAYVCVSTDNWVQVGA